MFKNIKNTNINFILMDFLLIISFYIVFIYSNLKPLFL